MKKVYFLGLLIILITGLMGCFWDEEVKEFQNGDQVIQNGVIYTFVSWDELMGLNGIRVYDFNECQRGVVFHHYYYFNMADRKQVPITPILGEVRHRLRVYSSEQHQNWQLMYHRCGLNDYFALYHMLADRSNGVYGSGFIASGYTNRLGRNVRIADQINGNNVIAIGYRAFENSRMRTLRWDTRGGIILPYAFNTSERLREIRLNQGIILSKGISNLNRLIKISGIEHPLEASLYNLPNLTSLIEFGANTDSFVMSMIIDHAPEHLVTPSRRRIHIWTSFNRAHSFVRNTPNIRKMTARSSIFRDVEIQMTSYMTWLGYEVVIFYIATISHTELVTREVLVIINKLK